MLEWERWGGGGGGRGGDRERGDALRSGSLVILYQRTTALQAMNVGILTVAKAMEVV